MPLGFSSIKRGRTSTASTSSSSTVKPSMAILCRLNLRQNSPKEEPPFVAFIPCASSLIVGNAGIQTGIQNIQQDVGRQNGDADDHRNTQDGIVVPA